MRKIFIDDSYVELLNERSKQQTKNLPAKLLLVLGILAAIAAMCSSGALPFAATAGQWSPGAQVEANATATAIAPALYATIQYNEDVLPEQQRVEREEITTTTRNAQAWKRYVDQAAGVAKIVGWASLALVFVGAGIGIGGTAGARGVREIRQATLPMTRRLAEGPHVTEYGTFLHTVTGAVVALDAPGDAQVEHGRLIAGAYATTPPALLERLRDRQREEWVRVSEQRLLT